MSEATEASGALEPGRELLEPTSGNTGIALALVAKLKGYALTCVLPENATEERRRLLRLYGATIVESPGEQGSNGAVRLALELAEREPRYFMPFQYANEANPRAHYEGTGAEIAAALDRVDLLVAGLGTGGTLMGAGARLREAFPDIVVAAAEPLPGDPVMGLRSLEEGYVPPILDLSKLDRELLVSNAEAVAASPYRVQLETEPENWFLEDEGYELAVFHSHPTPSTRPSRTDIQNVGLWAGRPYVILSLETDGLAAWQITDGEPVEVPLD